MKISLTDFIDFVAKSGAPKLTKVKEIKNRDEYNPATDYWKVVRDKIVEIHQNNLSINELDKILVNISESKSENYSKVIKNYKTLIGKKHYTWIAPPSQQIWESHKLQVTINPELSLELATEKLIIKLYFKSEPLSKSKADLILTLMKENIKKGKYSQHKICLWDIQNHKSYSDEKIKNNLIPLLSGEAISFTTIWNEI